MLCYTVTMLCIQRAQFPYLACYQTYQTWKENKIDITLLLVFLQMRKIRLNKAISFSSISFFSPLALWPNFKLARKGRRPLHDLTINSLMHFFKIHPDSCHFVRSSKLPIFCQLFCFFFHQKIIVLFVWPIFISKKDLRVCRFFQFLIDSTLFKL